MAMATVRNCILMDGLSEELTEELTSEAGCFGSEKIGRACGLCLGRRPSRQRIQTDFIVMQSHGIHAGALASDVIETRTRRRR